MAQTKKKSSASSRSGNRSKGSSSGSRSRKQSAPSYSMKQELIGLALIAVAIWLFVTVIGLGGNFGNVFQRVLFGLFGMGAYAFPVILVLAVLYMMFKGNRKQVVLQSICFTVLFLALCLFLELCFGNYNSMAKITDYYASGRDLHTGGGFFGGLFEMLLRKNIGQIATYAIDVLLIIAMAVIITGRSFFYGVKESSKAVASGTRAGGRKLKEAIELSEEEREERMLRREERKQARMDNKRSGVSMDTLVGAAPARTSSSDEMKELKVGAKAVAEQATVTPVLQSIEKELDGGFFSNTKVERVSEMPKYPLQTPYDNYREESNGQQTFVHELKHEPVNPPEEIKTEPPVREPKHEKLTKAESEKETEEFAKSTVTQTANANYKIPPLTLLKKGNSNVNKNGQNAFIHKNIETLERTFESFGVDAKVVNVEVGPAVTRYEIQPAIGVKVSKITSLNDDIKLALAAADVRIEAPIPGKSAVGIEVPNPENEMIMLRDLLESSEYQTAKAKIAFAVGKDISGSTLVADITKMPHMLIAGATGSGKSVCINTMIMSILYKYSPDQVKLIMIDPKVVELSVYNGIPHLLSPVVTDPKKAAGALNWGVMEMERRYQLFAESGVRDLAGYNDKVRSLPTPDENHVVLPQIVIIVDEMADLMMAAANDVETAICRLAQKARAAGMHLILATQRPSVDVITGLIKANMPSRVALSVSSGVDSRTILDMNGAERLLGHGDMLFYPQGYSSPKRVQGAYISDEEVEKVVSFLKEKNESGEHDESLANVMENSANSANATGGMNATGSFDEGLDDLFMEAGRFIMESEKCTVGALQRKFRIGFNRAARIVDQLEDAGVVGPNEGTKPREILMSPEQFEQYVEDYV